MRTNYKYYQIYGTADGKWVHVHFTRKRDADKLWKQVSKGVYNKCAYGKVESTITK